MNWPCRYLGLWARDTQQIPLRSLMEDFLHWCVQLYRRFRQTLPSAKFLIDAVQEAWSPIRNKGMTTLRSDLPDAWPGGATSLI